MDELESRINSVLNDPQQMEKISRLARSFMGGSEETGGFAPDDFGMSPQLLSRLSKLMSSGGDREKKEKALLEAMTPYLSEKRRGKMDKAMKIARLARLARLAVEESEGDA